MAITSRRWKNRDSNFDQEQQKSIARNHQFPQKLPARIVVSNLHKNIKNLFYETIKDMYSHISERSGQKAPLSQIMFMKSP
ncbi:hypothetical protein L1987_01491 [Smallanthus sonchifolius]|uniref:Uncharacterized protein n=1 Tax=Smallanthus sonchifolius TaxID=185202 RepID=A0ACB9K570_9ASTR|nr:hypothetical protein L1987_01491 [Smallanthus sonchifolius]